MCEFLISLLIVCILTCSILFIIKSLFIKNKGEYVEIIIDGNADEKQIEKLVISAKLAAEKYFPNARIYMLNADNSYARLLCREHNIFIKQ